MELLNASSMARVLGVSTKSLYRWVQLRKVPFIKLERHVRFEAERVIEHFRQQTEERPHSRAPSCFQSDLLLERKASGRNSLGSLKIRENKAAGSYPEKG